jgi:hypothetical protein
MVHALYLPAEGETVLWASRWLDEPRRLSLAFVGTNQAIHILNEAETHVLSVPVAFDLERYQIVEVGRLDHP